MDLTRVGLDLFSMNSKLRTLQAVLTKDLEAACLSMCNAVSLFYVARLFRHVLGALTK